MSDGLERTPPWEMGTGPVGENAQRWPGSGAEDGAGQDNEQNVDGTQNRNR